MTAVYSKGCIGNPLRSKGSELVMATDRSSNEILHYQKSDIKSTLFPIELFQHEEVDVHVDLLDANIYICSPEVLALFSDNFDIQDMDRMVNEIIESELIDSTIYLHISQTEFSSRVTNPYLYNVIYEKVLHRWAYPVVPERRLMIASEERDKICIQQNFVYRSASAKVAKGATIGSNTFLAKSVQIGSDCTVSNSNLEEAVIVANNCSITGSIIMKNTKIGEGCILTDCIVGENVVVADKCVLQGKIIIGHNSILKSGALVPAGTRICCEKSSDGFSDDEAEGEAAEGEYGPAAFTFVEEEEEDLENSDDEDQNKVEPSSYWGEVYLTEVESDSDSDSDGGSWSDEEVMSEEGEEISGDEQEEEHHDVKNFKREVLESLQRADAENNIVTDNLVLEINSSKHAWNTTLCEVNQCVLESVLTLNVDYKLQPAKLLQALKGNVLKFKQLLVKYSKSKSGQDYYLAAVPDLVKRYPPIFEVVAKLLHLLYDLDILSDESILKWSAKLQDTAIKTKISAFLDWLDEDDSEEESDEDSD